MAMAPRRKRPHTKLTRSLETFRTDLRITQKEAADLLGVSIRTWAAWEGGERIPTKAQLLAIEHLKKK